MNEDFEPTGQVKYSWRIVSVDNQLEGCSYFVNLPGKFNPKTWLKHDISAFLSVEDMRALKAAVRSIKLPHKR